MNSHDEWKAIQESLKTSAAEEARKRAVTNAMRPYADPCQPESSTAAARLYAAAAATSSVTPSGSSEGIGASDKNGREVPVAISGSNTSCSDDLYNSRSASQVPSTQGMSSKAKGKMADIPANTGSMDWDDHENGHDDVYGDSAYGNSSYGNQSSYGNHPSYGTSGEGSSGRRS
ncbi:hypothetical protein GGI21_006189 [Coemansia aciculifera]|nr:hypothetical protein GGI21_006189 [Coemansia aciculifera]